MDHRQQQQQEQVEDTATSNRPKALSMCIRKPSKEQQNDSSIDVGIIYCMECQINRFQYICPKCAFKTCSLVCCKAHKERFQCNGKRNRIGTFIPIRQMNDVTLQNDYYFLENVCAQIERTKSSQQLFKVKGEQQQKKRSHYNSNNNHSQKRPRQDGDTNNDNNEGNDYNTNDNIPPPHPLLQHQQPTVSIPGGHDAAASAPPPQLSLLRHQQHTNNNNNNNQLLHPKWRHFATLAWERHCIQILYMPSGMQRRINNKSFIQQAAPSRNNNKNGNNIRKQQSINNDKSSSRSNQNSSSSLINNKSVLYWTLEWRLHNPSPSSSSSKGTTNDDDQNNVHHHDDDDKNMGTATTTTTTTTNTSMTSTTTSPPVSELCSVGDALAQHLQRQKDYVDVNSSSFLEHYTVFIVMSNLQQQQQNQAKKQRRLVYYRKISMESTIAEALQHTRVIEYPTLEIVHQSRIAEFPQFIQTL